MGHKAKLSLKKGITIVVVLALINSIFVPWETLFPKRYSPMEAQWRALNDYSQIFYYYSDIISELYLYEQRDEDGNYSYRAMLGPTLDLLLGELVDTYNEDPSTTIAITEEYTRHYLTDRLLAPATSYTVYTSGGVTHYGPEPDEEREGCIEFIGWLDSTANLVYVKTRLHDNGNNWIEGRTAGTSFTNYQYIRDRNREQAAYNPWYDCVAFTWEYTPSSSTSD
ncbi:MAG: hypothetical protein FWD27_09085 [Coriobacteriia bacterium]|nr:hypothetical protein [Coriobacteriia bacterium]